MSLREKLQLDLHQAIRERDERRKAALRMVLLGIQLAEAESDPLSDEDIIQLIQKEIRRREGALELVRQAGRDDIIADDVAELEVLRAYLPEPLDEAALTTLVQEVIAQVGATSPADIGKVMPTLMPLVKGKADGRLVNQIVRRLLSE